MRWKREQLGRTRRMIDPDESTEQDRLRDALERRGVASDFAESLAGRLESQLDGRDRATQEAVLDGVATAYGVESRTHEDLDRNLRDLAELERLMKSFAGELSKLDESLEVLAAYLRRMRSRGAGSERARTLH